MGSRGLRNDSEELEAGSMPLPWGGDNLEAPSQAPIAAVKSRGGERRRAPGRRRGRGRPAALDSPSARGCKGQNYVPEEEQQLTVSVLAISQDSIVGNQQRATSFWECIGQHYEEHWSKGMGL